MEKDKLVNKVCQDINCIYTRLFDHRQFLNGELRSFLREFEEKRGNRDIEALLKSRQQLTEIDDSLNHFDETHKETIGKFQKQLIELSTVVEKICIPKPLNASTLEKNRVLRQEKWQKFLDQNTEKLLKVDNFVKEKELEYRQHYAELEEKLQLC